MALVISDDILSKINLSEKELMIDLACYLYDKKRLSMGKAKILVNMNLLEFQKELGKRNITIHYSHKDLDNDLKNLGIEL